MDGPHREQESSFGRPAATEARSIIGEETYTLPLLEKWSVKNLADMQNMNFIDPP